MINNVSIDGRYTIMPTKSMLFTNFTMLPMEQKWNNFDVEQLKLIVAINNTNSNMNLTEFIEAFVNLKTLHIEQVLTPSLNLVFENQLNLGKLKMFNFIDSEVQTLSGINLLENVNTIESISLANNQLKYIDNYRFFPKYNENFRFLDLSGNQFVTFDYVLPASITAVHLQANHLVELNMKPFANNYKILTELWLFSRFSFWFKFYFD